MLAAWRRGQQSNRRSLEIRRPSQPRRRGLKIRNGGAKLPFSDRQLQISDGKINRSIKFCPLHKLGKRLRISRNFWLWPGVGLQPLMKKLSTGVLTRYMPMFVYALSRGYTHRFPVRVVVRVSRTRQSDTTDDTESDGASDFLVRGFDGRLCTC